MKKNILLKKIIPLFLVFSLLTSSGQILNNNVYAVEDPTLIKQIQQDTKEAKQEIRTEEKVKEELQKQQIINQAQEKTLESRTVLPVNQNLVEQTKGELLNKETTSASKEALDKMNIERVETKEALKEISNPTEGNIYPWLPSMVNIYKGQIIQSQSELQIFGARIFDKDSTVLQGISDVPVGNDYVIGVGDTLQITIWGGVNTSFDTVVSRDGNITLPEVGTFYVVGRNFGSLKEQIGQKLNEIFNNVSVDVSLGKLRSIKVFVMGEAKNPGSYEVSSISTVFNTIFRAGGPSLNGSMRNIDIIRDKKVIKKVDLYDFLLRGDKNSDIRLQSGDTIFFNLRGKTAGVDGLVNRSAIFELKNEKNLAQLLNMAGGLVPTSYLKKIQIKRVEPNKEIVTVNLDLSKVKAGDFTIRDKDIVRVFPILPVDKQTIYLNGHVFRPGTYEYKKNMTVNDLIDSYKDLLPEPYTEYAQIIRLQEPDLKPYTIMFNLGEIINKKNKVDLKPFDTIMIFSKWSFTRIPEAEIIGEVFKPGKYKLLKGTKIADLITKAEGFTKNTYLDRAEVIRRVDGYGNKQTFSINLSEAMKGNTKNNIELKDEDLVIIHSLNDIIQDKSVGLSGNITKPGRYPLGKEMRVKDLLNLGGAFRKSAYLVDAELVRYSVENNKVSSRNITIDLQKALNGDPENNILLKDMDLLHIRQIPNWYELSSDPEALITGEIRKPGNYKIKGQRLTDLINQAEGLTNEAYLDRAEVIRFVDDYGNRQVFSINLAEAMRGNLQEDIEIKKRDVIFIHKISDIFTERKVYVVGEVSKPGEYPLGVGMKVSDLLNLSGSLKKSAYDKEAELVRYYIDGSSVTFSTNKIDLKKVQSGDPEHNLVLRDLDRLVIRKISNWENIGMSVTLDGEIKYPGTYVVSPDETIYDVLMRAGGFTQSAYVQGLKFFRNEVKDIQQKRLEKLIMELEQSLLYSQTDDINIQFLNNDQLEEKKKSDAYRRSLLENLKKVEVTGRVILNIRDLEKFKRSEQNIFLKNNDYFYVPSKPQFVSVVGEVFNQTGIVFQKGKTLDFYLKQAGGMTPDAEVSKINIVKSDGSVISAEGRWFYNIYGEVLEPGDSILVPQIITKSNPLETLRILVDIGYKTAVAAGIFIRN